MTEKILTIEKSNMIINLYKEKLEVDFKEGILKKVEDVIEENPLLNDSLGFLMQTVFPLDVLLRDIEEVERAEGKIRIIIPMRKDIELPLTDTEIDLLYAKLMELIFIEKDKYYKKILAQANAQKESEKNKYQKGSRII